MSQFKRLRKIRETLELTQRDVCFETDIPKTTYHQMETRRSHVSAENLRRLVVFFNRHWQSKFAKKGNYPCIEGNKTRAITIAVVLYGKDEVLEYMENYVKLIEEEFRRRELDYVERINLGE
jgi:transcriptional regulator with XRE-family HTH domain